MGLTNTVDLIICDRIQTSELKFYAHWGWMQEDIFIAQSTVNSSRLSAKRTEACGYGDVSFDSFRYSGPLSPQGIQAG